MHHKSILVNARFLLPGKLEGIGWYSHEILRRLVKLLPDTQFVFLFDRQFSPEFVYAENVLPVVAGPQARHPVLWYWWFEHTVPAILKRHHAAVFFSPDGYGSLHAPCPQVVTIHDLAFEHYPQQVPALVRQYYRYFTPRYIEKADTVLAVSHATRSDIINQYGTPDKKIQVWHNGCNGGFVPLTNEEKEIVRGTVTRGKPYFIFVSALHPRKNVVGVLRAFEAFKAKHGTPHQLVIAGRRAWGNAEMEQVYAGMRYASDIIFSGHLDRQALSRSLAAAEALIYPSFFEGFGLPLVEAMYCEVPIITSNVSSMPEVAGDAALLIAPEDPMAIANAMTRIVFEKGLKENLQEAARNRRGQFSWDRSAEGLAALLSAY
jgi:glycosyltransferase involved in cell wall biosynthesis